MFSLQSLNFFFVYCRKRLRPSRLDSTILWPWWSQVALGGEHWELCDRRQLAALLWRNSRQPQPCPHRSTLRSTCQGWQLEVSDESKKNFLCDDYQTEKETCLDKIRKIVCIIYRLLPTKFLRLGVIKRSLEPWGLIFLKGRFVESVLKNIEKLNLHLVQININPCYTMHHTVSWHFIEYAWAMHWDNDFCGLQLYWLV